MTNQQMIEILEQTKTSIQEERFDFSDWRHCTCGHLYRATTGEAAKDPEILEPQGEWLEVAERVARLVSRRKPESLTGLAAVIAISEDTSRSTRIKYGIPLQYEPAAIRSLDKAIRKLKKEIKGMDIGKEIRTIQVEPASNPVPDTIPQRETVPARTPVTAPEPERVPARD